MKAIQVALYNDALKNFKGTEGVVACASARALMVVKSNELIQKRMFDLTLEEQRLVLFALSKIRPDATSLAESIEFSIREFCSVCGLSRYSYKGMRQFLKDTISKLATRNTWIENNGKKESLILWINSEGRTEIDGDTAYLHFSSKMEPYLVCLKSFYTQYPLMNILLLKSKYSIRLFELLASFENQGTFNMSIEYLRKHIGATDVTYNNVTNFYRRILLPSIDEINRFTTLKIELFNLVKTGRKYTHIDFKVKELGGAERNKRIYAMNAALNAKALNKAEEV